MREYIDNMILPNEEVPITYIDQAIPSLYGMPKYEDVKLWLTSTLDNECLMTFEDSIDITGARVNSYYATCCLISMVQRSKRLIPYSMESPYMYLDDHHNAVLLEFKIPSRLQPNHHRICPTEKDGVMCLFYHHIWKQLYKYTKVWRGEVGQVKLLILPVSPDNESKRNVP